MSPFDPATFLDAQQDTPNTKRPPLPKENPTAADGCYMVLFENVEMKSGTIEKGDRAGQPWMAAVVTANVEVPQQVQDGLGIKLDKGVLRMTEWVMLDLNAQNNIDNSAGKNRRQRQYREALDLNKAGDVFSWRKVIGQACKCKIDHEMYLGDPVDKLGALLRR